MLGCLIQRKKGLSETEALKRCLSKAFTVTDHNYLTYAKRNQLQDGSFLDSMLNTERKKEIQTAHGIITSIWQTNNSLPTDSITML